MEPTIEQVKIINADNNTVVIAQPGSGKTFTLANKIKIILESLPDYKGVIAISYTNKASKELEKRSLGDGLNKKNSFFGTMDKFYISEIILPFGRHLFGKPQKETEIVELRSEVIKSKVEFLYDFTMSEIIENHLQLLRELYICGYVVLESVPLLSLYILRNSKACRNYIKARFSHIIIDEYQDCGVEQHDVFIEMKNIGLTAIAVGDENQSIYGFANKSSEFLLKLANDESFDLYRLTKNHRCHPSIINYSMSLISRDFNDFLPSEENRVFSISINGKEEEVATWLDETIPKIMKRYNVSRRNEVGILSRTTRTASFINNSLTLKHKFFDNTPFDNDSSLWGRLFSGILKFIFDSNNTKYELVEEYFDIELQKEKANRAMDILSFLENVNCEDELILHKDNFIQIAEFVYPKARNQNAINILEYILNNSDLINSFKPAKDDEVQIMTLHKSKGLEFEIVFHLDLHEYIFPSKRKVQGIFVLTDKEQDLNLHYVGITRAKNCCVLCSSTKRTNASNEIKYGSLSEFLQIPRLKVLRSHFEI